MDRGWMYLEDRLCKEYIDGVKSFLEKAQQNKIINGFPRWDEKEEARCPCRVCKNNRMYSVGTIECHLYRHGFASNYKRWIYHGEEFEHSKEKSLGNRRVMLDENNSEEEDILVSNDVRRPASSYNNYDDLVGDSNKTEDSASATETSDFTSFFDKVNSPLYPGCTEMSGLDFLAKLMHLKVLNDWSEKSLDMLLLLLKDAFPEGANLPASHHEAKKSIHDLGFGYQLIHACKYDCALFWKEHASCDKCPICDEPRYKYEKGDGTKIAQKVLYYFPLKPRLQRLFMSKNVAMDMRWHKEKRVDVEGVFKHPADSEEWKNVDKQYSWFAQDARNVRLGLATKGFNPFGNMSKPYSMFPVTLVPYNLPPEKCMNEAFFMMTLLIPGPESPGRDIDIYLRPLIDELKDLWSNGVETRDSLSGETFQLHACLLWTINDFLTYESLYGWGMTSVSACPICKIHTPSIGLRNKVCHLGHRRHLPPDHTWRDHRQYDASWGPERNLPIRRMSGKEIFMDLDFKPKPGKNPNNKDRKRMRPSIFSNWIKKSVFFELDYWTTLRVKHNFDVMYIEKSFCDNIIGTLLNIEGKTKDTNCDRMDLADLDIRSELHFRHRHNRVSKPPACYVLPLSERSEFCRYLKYVKLPDAYPIDFSKNINIKDGKISGYQARDCHVILQRILPVAVHSYLHKDITTTLTELSNFFQQLCAKTLHAKDLDKLEERIALILCKFEKIYPPSFFDIMVHSAAHLPEEAKLAGPVGFRWLHPFERNWETLRKYVKKNTQPEYSIAEAYSASEALRFCSMYLHDADAQVKQNENNNSVSVSLGKRRASLSVFSQPVQPFGHQVPARLSSEELHLAQLEVLRNCDELEPYEMEHKEELKKISSVDVLERHAKEFASWFENRIKDLRQTEPTKVSDELYSLACGPNSSVTKYSGCIVDGVKFLTEEEDDHRISRNSLVCTFEEYNDETINFYGTLCSVWELNYTFGYRVVLFKCKWFKTDPNEMTTDCNISRISPNRSWYEIWPFVLADQVQQVFSLSNHNYWMHFQKLQHRLFWDVLETSANEELDEAFAPDANPDTLNFQWTENVGDIEAGSLVCKSGKAEVINANVVPNVSDEAVGDETEKFDDLWIDSPMFYESPRSEYMSDADSN